DKTGTLTSNNNQQITYIGDFLTKDDLVAIKNIVRGSNHPLSRRLYLILPDASIEKPTDYQEVAGKGIQGDFKGKKIKIGSSKWIGVTTHSVINQTRVYISINGDVKGYYAFENEYRKGMKELFETLNRRSYKLFV